MTNQFWNDDRYLMASQLWKQGLSAGRIAAKMGCTRNMVIGMANRNRTDFPRRGRYNAWTAAEKATALAMWLDGFTAQEIADAIGRSKPAIYGFMHARRAHQ